MYRLAHPGTPAGHGSCYQLLHCAAIRLQLSFLRFGGCSTLLVDELRGCSAPQAPSWSSTDYGGHWKLLHYAAKRFFSPLLISADYNKVSNIVSVYLTSDINQALRGAPSADALCIGSSWVRTEGRCPAENSSGGRDCSDTTQLLHQGNLGMRPDL